jgi:hypothetical protein
LVETTGSESPLTQPINVALPTLCKFNNASRDALFHDLIGASETVNVFHRLVVSGRHQGDVCRFKYLIPEEWNDRGHGPFPSPATLSISPPNKVASCPKFIMLDFGGGRAENR